MSQQQMVHFRLLKYLLVQLKNFGLNPVDWKIERTSLFSKNQIFLVHRDDREFKFVGNLGVKNGLLSWNDLKLISL